MPHYEQHKFRNEVLQNYNIQFQYARNIRTFFEYCFKFFGSQKRTCIFVAQN